jgi:DNA-binding transcriptional ArsR family regulator
MAKVDNVAIDILVTPRFEIFYALKALQSDEGEHLQGWRREMRQRLTPRIRSRLTRVAPSPLMWPLLADSLRDSPPAAGFTEMMADMRGMSDDSFQRAVLNGVFKAPGSVEALLSKQSTIAATVAHEAESQERLLSLLGLYPFSIRAGSAAAFNRLVNDPAAYREEVVNLVVSFWAAGFAETWGTLEPQLRDRARAMKHAATRDGAPQFAKMSGLPIAIDETGIRSIRGTTRVDRNDVAGIHVIPSAFNTASFWAAYRDTAGKTRFFFPLLDTSLSPDTRIAIEPSLVFSALGDTTRYAMAATIARKPMTSVELARAFSVSKPTISHHVQVLRAAGLVDETHTENGTLLALNRRVLERASGAAAREMFSGEGTSRSIKRTRKPNKSHK